MLDRQTSTELQTILDCSTAQRSDRSDQPLATIQNLSRAVRVCQMIHWIQIPTLMLKKTQLNNTPPVAQQTIPIHFECQINTNVDGEQGNQYPAPGATRGNRRPNNKQQQQILLPELRYDHGYGGSTRFWHAMNAQNSAIS